ncbi:HEWD family protein [Halolamina litorea]|uniref:HEWD family protein n=1 Tax=Halolamina litorea TaxID=1515593 RepID=A0ABD6BSC6_9EURY|nr:HEWD family protein [Halolamina litorea]
MTDLLRTPERRTCERCGRVERHDGADGWRAARVGEIHCIHEWDIDGAFVPVSDVDPDAVAAEPTAAKE